MTVAALVAGLGLAAALPSDATATDRAMTDQLVTEPAIPPEVAIDGPPMVRTVSQERPPAPSLDAADLVGIYRAGACTLTLDASGTYIQRGCGDGRAHAYTIERDQVVLRDVRLVADHGRLVSATGTTYTITGGVR